MNPAFSNSPRWFSQLGSDIHTWDCGKRRRRKSAPTFRAPVTEGLQCNHAVFRNRRAPRAKNQIPHCAVIGWQAVDGQVTARGRFLGQLELCLAHAIEQGHLAVFVVIDADPQVDLVRILVCVEGLGDSENGVLWGHLHGGERRSGVRSVHRDNI